jgi:hypothetical protein
MKDNKMGYPLKPGDWYCGCGELNFSSRDMCRRCMMPKPMDVLEGDMGGFIESDKGMDWFCACGESNFAARNMCRRCGDMKPGMDKPDLMNMNIPLPIKTTMPKGKTQYRPGDWFCMCGNMNYASREACNRCGVAKAVLMDNGGLGNGSFGGVFDAGNRSHKMRSSDWVCACGEMNFAYRNLCRKCNKGKSSFMFRQDTERAVVESV